MSTLARMGCGFCIVFAMVYTYFVLIHLAMLTHLGSCITTAGYVNTPRGMLTQFGVLTYLDVC